MGVFENKNNPPSGLPELSRLDRFLRIFSDIRPGEGTTGLILLLNIFLVLAAYYLIKPVREGWLSISAIKGLSKVEIKAYSSFGQSMALLFIVPLYAHLAERFSRRGLLTFVTLFFSANLVVFWLLHPGFLSVRVPYVAIVFYLWVGIFSVTVVAQFWSFAADLYTDELGKRLFPLIGIGASAGAAFGAWFTGRYIKLPASKSFDLILLAVFPLLGALVLSWIADRRGASARAGSQPGPGRKGPVADDPSGAFGLVFKYRYLLGVALLGLLINWVNTNGENILFRSVQEALSIQQVQEGLTDPAVIARFVSSATTAFYGDLYFWVNLTGLVVQAFLVSRLIRYAGFAPTLLLTPVISFFSYGLMAAFPILSVIRISKIAENSTNYSVNNTAKHILWLPLPPSMIYKAKVTVDTFFTRMGDGLAALTVLVGTQIISLSLKQFMVFNVLLASIWTLLAVAVVRENRRLLRTGTLEGRTPTIPTLQEDE
jgi:AAA family ATP:ADP antiporter